MIRRQKLLFLIALGALGLVDIKAEDTAVEPDVIDLVLAEGDRVEVDVSYTFIPVCVTAFDVDVIASDSDALVENLSGVQMNGCGGDKSEFTIAITGTGMAQIFLLRFVDTLGDSVLAELPVSISPPDLGEVEEILGVWSSRRAMFFQVFSSGCTSKDDFAVDVMESWPLQLKLRRISPDPCDAVVPLGKRIRFNYRELGIRAGDRYRVVNPLGVVQVP